MRLNASVAEGLAAAGAAAGGGSRAEVLWNESLLHGIVSLKIQIDS